MAGRGMELTRRGRPWSRTAASCPLWALAQPLPGDSAAAQGNASASGTKVEAPLLGLGGPCPKRQR